MKFLKKLLEKRVNVEIIIEYDIEHIAGGLILIGVVLWMILR
jgi:hypothetical protein